MYRIQCLTPGFRKIVFSIFLLVGIFLPKAHAQNATPLELTTPRGAKINVVVNYPEVEKQSKTCPAIIIAPGQGYHMDMPLIRGIAEGAAKDGIAAFRFNWHYFTASIQPSPDRVHENEDMKSVIDFVKTDKKIDPSRIVLAGKSLGSIVCYANFRGNPNLAGLFLLTPICLNDQNMNTLYPDLAKVTIPTMILLGNKDNFGNLGVLYRNLQTAGNNIVTVVFPGDHSLNVEKVGESEISRKNNENVELAVSITLHWLNHIFDEHSKK